MVVAILVVTIIVYDIVVVAIVIVVAIVVVGWGLLLPSLWCRELCTWRENNDLVLSGIFLMDT